MSAETTPTPEQLADPAREQFLEQKRKERLAPERTALLVVDMQNDFLHPDGYFAQKLKVPIERMRSTVPFIQGMVEQAHAAGVQVIYTQGYEDVKFRDPDGPDALRALEWDEEDGNGSVNSESGTWGSEFFEGITPQDGDIILEKHSWSAFDGKDKAEPNADKRKGLEEILKEKGIRTLVITGVVTETCIETTTRDAFSKGYTPFFPEHSIGSDDEDQHRIRMDYYKTKFLGGSVLDEEKFKEYWQEASAKKEVAPAVLVQPAS